MRAHHMTSPCTDRHKNHITSNDVTWHDATSHHITSQDLTWHLETNHITASRGTSQPTTLLHLTSLPTTWHNVPLRCTFFTATDTPRKHNQPPPKVLEEREKFVRRGRTWSSASHLTGKMAGKVTHKQLGDCSWREDEPCVNLLGSTVTKSALTRFRTSSCSSFQPYQGKPCYPSRSLLHAKLWSRFLPVYSLLRPVSQHGW